MTCPARLYPLRKPKNHRLPVPRYTLALPGEVTRIHISYIGVQQHSNDAASTEAKTQVCQEIQSWLESEDGPATYESFSLLDGREAPGTTVWVGYWTDAGRYTKALDSLNLLSIYHRQPILHQRSLGLWKETFSTPVSRAETNYSGLDYLPGLGQLPNTTASEHDLATYWGAARDRIPDSATDLFPRPATAPSPTEPPDPATASPTLPPESLRHHLTGTNHHNIVHIRSGQWWSNCNPVEAAAYETNLEPTLRAGLDYLTTHPSSTGALCVRYLRNTCPTSPAHDTARKETCGAGFFANLEDLETWAKTHSSHLGIWRGAMAHYKAFPDGERKFRTWHEVCVIEEGEARWEYVNCSEGTGVLGAGVGGLEGAALGDG